MGIEDHQMPNLHMDPLLALLCPIMVLLSLFYTSMHMQERGELYTPVRK